MGERYWNLGNAITGFVVLQSIGFLYTLSDHDKFCYIVKAEGFLTWAGWAACAMYVAGVVFCAIAHRIVAKGTWEFVDGVAAFGQVLVIVANTGGIIWFAQTMMDKADANGCAAVYTKDATPAKPD